MRRLVFLIAVVALLAAGCSDSSEPQAAPETTAVVEPSTTLAPATSTSARPATTVTTLRPTTTVTTMLALGPGDAVIGGTVSGPAGPLDGATVRVERLVGKAVATQDVTTSGGGIWQIASVLGGSYRVWAFRPPDFGQSPVEAFFLGANDRNTRIDFKLPVVTGDRITAVVNPNPPRVDQHATLTIQYGVGRVDDQGRSVISPRAGVVLTLVAGPGIVVESTAPVLTDGNGSASWSIRCSAEGARSMTLTIANGVTSVNLPPCGPPLPAPAPTTTKAP